MGVSRGVDGGADWHLTEDLCYRDAESYLWFKARDDALREAIHSDYCEYFHGGYRKMLAQRLSALLWIALAGQTRSNHYQTLVGEQVAKYEYPRAIGCIEELPTTTTGKIQRRKLRETKY